MYIILQTEVKKFFEWKTALPSWIIAFIFVLLFFLVYWCYKLESGTNSKKVKVGLGFFRLIVLIILFLIYLEPIWHETKSKTRKSYVIFLIDSSLSMNIEDFYKDPLMNEFTSLNQKIKRIDIVNKIIKKCKKIKKLQKDCKLKFFKFDTDLYPITPFKKVVPKGQQTDIYNNLVKSIEILSGRTINSIFLFTDGQHNVLLSKKDKLIEETILYAVQRDIPIYTIGVGSKEKKKDIILKSIDAPEVALAEDKVRFNIEIKNIGYDEINVPIYLKWGDVLLEEKWVTLKKSDELQKVSIEHIFTAPGDYNLTIKIPKQFEEFTDSNNYKKHLIRIIKNRLKVLYLEGLPRWEYRYLKNALIRDETVIANTWLFSADPTFPQEKSKIAPSINGFPSREELFKFHVVIIGDVDPLKLSESNKKDLLEFVEKGGGIIFISGENYNPKLYVDTSLAPLLPIEIEEYPEYDYKLRSIKLTSEGKVSSILKLLPNYEENIELLEKDLPKFYWSFPIKKVKPGATILATDNYNNPIMITQMYGRGRIFFCGIDSTWRWRYLCGDKYFYRFWGQVMRYIGMNRLLNISTNYYLTVDKTLYYLGERVNIVLKIKNSPEIIKEKEWKIYYTLPNGKEKEKTLISSEKEENTFIGSLVTTKIGKYKIWLKNPENGKEIKTYFNVLPPISEAGNTELNDKDLKYLAEKTDGRYFKPYEVLDFIKKLTPKKDIIPDIEKEYPYWDKLWIMILIISLFSIEWILRKLFYLT